MKKILAIIVSVAALSGCYKSDVYETYHPTEAKVEFSYDDKGSKPEKGGFSLSDIMGEFTLYFDDEVYDLEDGKAVEIPYLLEPGSYTYYIYNVVEDDSAITYKSRVEDIPTKTPVTAPTASAQFEVDKVKRQILASVEALGGVIITASDDLYFGTETLNFVKDTDYWISATLYLVTRDLNIKIELDGDSAERLESVAATLSGVASKWDCINDCPYTESTAIIYLGIDEEDDKFYLVGNIKLLGTYGDKQTLTLTMNYEDGNPATHTVTSDLSSDLANFNKGKHKPLNLGATYDVPNETSSNGVITGWNPENEGGVEIK